MSRVIDGTCDYIRTDVDSLSFNQYLYYLKLKHEYSRPDVRMCNFLAHYLAFNEALTMEVVI